MVAANTKRHDAGGFDRLDVLVNIFDGVVQAEPGAKRHVPHVCAAQHVRRHHVQRVVIRPYPFDGSHGAWAKACAGTVGHTEVHRNANQRGVEIVKRIRKRCVQEGGNPAVGKGPITCVRKQYVRNGFKTRVKNIITLGFGIWLVILA